MLEHVLLLSFTGRVLVRGLGSFSLEGLGVLPNARENFHGILSVLLLCVDVIHVNILSYICLLSFSLCICL